MKEKLIVSIELDGNIIKVGELSENRAMETSFAYDKDYLESPEAARISVSLPLRPEPFSTERTRIFFEGLLPEGFTRQSVARNLRVDSGDYLSILHGLGRECLGALMISAEGEENTSSYEKLSVDQVHALAAEGTTKSAELVTKAHLSLTGASGKVGLFLDEESGDWYLPKGNAPSTHIVKQSHVRLDGIVTNEQLVMMTAKKLGLDVPESFIINIDGTDEGDVLLASKRYDRVISGKKQIDGLKCPERLHQEDFSQAMQVAAIDKYERDGEHYFRRMFDILRNYSSNPLADQIKLWDKVVFDYLVGNTDNHIKNVSLLYSSNLRSLRLAPAYDILSTAVYDSSTREMGFAIGGKYLLEAINRNAFEKAADEVGLGTRTAMQHFDSLAGKFEKALEESAGELEEKGFEKAGTIRNKILEKGGYAEIA